KSAEDLVASAARIVVLEHVANPDNLGGVFRNAAALGFDALLLSGGCCDPLYRKAIRTSMAATLRVPFAMLDDWPASLAQLRARGFTIVALTPSEPSDDLDEFARRPRPERVALLVGAEGAGLSEAALALAHCRVRIPIAPEID